MKAGLFGGGRQDYLGTLNDAFDQHAMDNWLPQPFGASVDAILAGYPNGAMVTLPSPADSLERKVDLSDGTYAPGGAGDGFSLNAMMAPVSGHAPVPVTPAKYSASRSGSFSQLDSGGLGQPSGLQFPQGSQSGSYPDSAVFLELRGIVNPNDPDVRQAQINDALKVNHLDPHGWPVQYYPNMGLETDRDGNPNQDTGRTTDRVGVQIGPKAFEGSKGNFYSTLDHEVGGHVGQMVNHTFSGPGEGHYMNEVEAYDRELQHAEQHGLTDDEIGGIRSNRDWYFNQLSPENQVRVNKGIYTPRK